MTNPVTSRAGILVGPTAVGKSAVAQWLAEQTRSAILSADSMLVYQGMDIGTAKPTVAERGNVPYFGIDCVPAGAHFDTGEWIAFVARQRRERPAEAALPLIVAGGTGLYVKALLEGLDSPVASDLAERAKWNDVFAREGIEGLRRAIAARHCEALLAPSDGENPRRLIRALERAAAGETSRGGWKSAPERPPIAGLSMDRSVLNDRIFRRIKKMFEDGLVEEALRVRETCGALSPTACQAIGYEEALAIADGAMGRDEAIERIAVRTRHLAKRQMTWFRHQMAVEWIEVEDGESPESIGERVLGIWRKHGLSEIRI